MEMHDWIISLLLAVSLIGWVWILLTFRELMIANSNGESIISEIKEEIQTIKSALKELR